MIGNKHQPADLRTLRGKKAHNNIEVKTILFTPKQGVRVLDDAHLRKVHFHANSPPGSVFHTIVIDARRTYEGGAYKHFYSGHYIYYKRGSGDMSLSKMYKVRSFKELQRLIAAPNHKLPEAARGALPSGQELVELIPKAADAAEARAGRNERHYDSRKAKSAAKRLEAAKNGK